MYSIYTQANIQIVNYSFTAGANSNDDERTSDGDSVLFCNEVFWDGPDSSPGRMSTLTNFLSQRSEYLK